MRTLLAQRRLRLYFLGTTLSTIGDYALWLAAGVWVKELTGSIAQAGICLLCLILGTLFAPVTGYVVDRLPRKPLLLATNAVTGLLVLTLTQVRGPGEVWLIYAVMFVNGLATSLTDSATMALLPRLVEPEQLGAANGLTQSLTQGQRLITPAIGLGLLAAFGGGAVAALDAASFAAGILCWLFIQVDDARPEPTTLDWRADTTAGFRFLLRSRPLRQLTGAMVLGLFVIGLFDTLALAVATIGLHRPPTWVGVIVTVMGVSGILSGVVVGRLITPLGAGRLTALGLALCGAGALAMAAPVPAVVIFAALLLGFAVPFVIVGAVTALQLSTPNELLGRVSGARAFATTMGQVLGMATGSALISVVFYRDLAYTSAAVLALCALYLFTRPEQRPQPVAADAPADATTGTATDTALGQEPTPADA